MDKHTNQEKPEDDGQMFFAYLSVVGTEIIVLVVLGFASHYFSSL